MAKQETSIQNLIHLAITNISTLFRNNRGMFYTLDKKRKVRAGLEVNGSSDLIGWTEVEVTQEMVGKKVAVFTGIEVKTHRGRVSEAQQIFKDNVNRAGGISIVARSPEEAVELLRSAMDELAANKI